MKKLIARICLSVFGLALIVALILASLYFEKQKPGDGIAFAAVTLLPIVLAFPLSWCVLNALD